MRYYKAVVFCSNPVRGVLRFRDVFQIYPLTVEGAPHNKVVKGHPFILEYCIAEEKPLELEGDLKSVSHIVSEWTHSANFQNEILRFLTAFSSYRFYFPRAVPQWFVSIESGLSEEEMNNQSSRVGLNVYRYPTMSRDAVITSFTKVNFPEIEPKEHINYFNHIDLDGEEPVQFSQYILAAFHNYFLLNEEQRAVVNSCVLLVNQGIELRETMPSLAFIAFISSIETLVALENKGVKVENCKECGQPRYRVMAKFRDFILNYVMNSTEVKKEIDAIYGLRSKIAHEGLLFLGDGVIDWTDSEKKKGEGQALLQAMMLSRVSLMNWILRRGEKETKTD